MSIRPVHILLGLAVLPAPALALSGNGLALAPLRRDATPWRLAQAADQPAAAQGSPSSHPPETVPDGSGSTPSSPPATFGAPDGTPAAAKAKPAANAQVPAAPPAPALTGVTRNTPDALPSMARPGTTMTQPGAAASLPFGGPQNAIGPAYGSTLRDSGTVLSGPIYSTAPTTPGAPVNGTANAYTSSAPDGSLPNGYVSSVTGIPGSVTTPNNDSAGYTQQPLGGRPNSRDQSGTLGARGGYNARGIYTGTAAQPVNGYGYGSVYATTGRPIGGLLGTNVDATGPLRPYVPLNSGPGGGPPNSGYGVPNGSRGSHMDARGIQRIN